MLNEGKRFENNFRKSLDKDSKEMFFYRFKDGTSSWSPNEATRFQSHNIADCIIFYKNTLFICELKSHKGKSLPLTCIRPSQLEEMLEANEKKDVYSIVFIYFSDLNVCYALPINYVNQVTEMAGRKSIPIDYCEKYGFKVACQKLKTNCKYAIKEFLDDFIKNA